MKTEKTKKVLITFSLHTEEKARLLLRAQTRGNQGAENGN